MLSVRTKSVVKREIDNDAKRIGEIIKRRCRELKISGAELARRVGIKQPSMSNIMKGLTKQSPHLAVIADRLGLPLAELIPDLTTGYKPVDNFSHRGDIRPVRDFPVYFMEKGRTEGTFVVTAEAVEWVERPSLLMTVKESFGICVYGDAMAPLYKPGDIVFIHPYQPPVPGTDVIIRRTDDGDLRIVLGELVSETDADWKILQHRNHKTMTLGKADWSRCDRIVGKYNRR